MKTSSNGNIFALLALCEGNPPVSNGFSSQRPVTWGFELFFDLHLNKRFANNQDPGDLRRHRDHYDVIVMSVLRMVISFPFYHKFPLAWKPIGILFYENYYYEARCLHSYLFSLIIFIFINYVLTSNKLRTPYARYWSPKERNKARARLGFRLWSLLSSAFHSLKLNGMLWSSSGPLFTKRLGVLPPNLVKSRSREIGCYNDRIALKFDRHLGSTAADLPVNFQSDMKSLNPNLAASRLDEILR